jgi:hypothetical protein
MTSIHRRTTRHRDGVSCALLLVASGLAGCGGGGGSDAEPPAITISATPSTVTQNQTSAITWSANATSCSASGSWQGSRPTSGIETTGVLSAVGTQSFTLSCSGPGGTSTETASVTVLAAAVPAPQVGIALSEGTVTIGQSTDLTWSSENATSCVASGSWTGERPLSGTTRTEVATAAGLKTYTLECTGPGGTTRSTTTLNVAPATTPAPTAALSITPPSVTAGQSAEIEWSSQNATSCLASNAWAGEKDPSGSDSTGPLTITGSFVYTLSCEGPGGTVERSATLAVQPPPPTPTVILGASSQSVSIGESIELAWESANTATCVAEDDWTGIREPSGRDVVGPLDEERSYRYTLICSDAAGASAEAEVNVSVRAQPRAAIPTVTLSVDDSEIGTGETTTLRWEATDAANCVARNGWSGDKPLEGEEVIGPFSTGNLTLKYELSCASSTGKREVRSVEVKISGVANCGIKCGLANSLTADFGEGGLSVSSGTLEIDVADLCSTSSDDLFSLYTGIRTDQVTSVSWTLEDDYSVDEVSYPFIQRIELAQLPYDASVQAFYKNIAPAVTATTNLTFLFQATTETTAVRAPSRNKVIYRPNPTTYALTFAVCTTQSDDIDIRVKEPSGDIISYSSPGPSSNGGSLIKDVLDGSDFEEVVYPLSSGGIRPPDGPYCVSINNRSSASTFAAIRGASNGTIGNNRFGSFALKLAPTTSYDIQIFHVVNGAIDRTEFATPGDPRCAN